MQLLLSRLCAKIPAKILIGLITLQIGRGRPGEDFLLAVDREISVRDYRSLQPGIGTFNIRTINGLFFYALAAKLIPAELRQTTPSQVWPPEFFRASRKFDRMILKLKDQGFRGVITANTNYWNDQPFRISVENAGLPTFVIMKEAVLTELHNQQWRESSFPVMKSSATKIFVANQDTYAAMIANGTATAAQLIVSGLPRFELPIRKIRKSKQPDLLFLSFGNLLQGQFWEVNHQCIQLAMKFCADTGAQMTIKLKDSREYKAWKNRGVMASADSVAITWKEDIRDLIAAAKFCVGGPSLSSVEAMGMGKTVLSPAWGVLSDPSFKLLPDPGNSNLLLEASDHEQFLAYLHSSLDNLTVAQPPQTTETSVRWAFRPKGGTSHFILDELKKVSESRKFQDEFVPMNP